MRDLINLGERKCANSTPSSQPVPPVREGTVGEALVKFTIHWGTVSLKA